MVNWAVSSVATSLVLLLLATLQSDSFCMHIIVKPTPDDLAKVVAKIIVDRIRVKPNLVLGLATGSSPLGVYKELIRYHKEEGVDFSKVVTFNLDEYLGLKPDHDQSYNYFMWHNLFDHLNVTRANVHIPQGNFKETDEEAIAQFCDWYEKRIASFGGLDIQLLGIGSDGHIAFNEPGSSLSSRTRVEKLLVQTVKDNARFFNNDMSKVPTKAITMGVGTIMEAKELVLVAYGKGKASAMKQTIEGPICSMCPASVLQWHQRAYLVIDTDAASSLSPLAQSLATNDLPPLPRHLKQ